MSLYFGLGANEGDRAGNLERAIQALASAGLRIDRVSPLVESPALLPTDISSDAADDPRWRKPYLNLAVRGAADWSVQEGLAVAKRIERELGRADAAARAKWAPRPIDIDLLWWRGEKLQSATLNLPHADAARRDFVLTPLLHLQPDLPVGARGESVFELTRAIHPIPLWMAIVNLTPDSFSDGGEWADEDALDAYFGKLIARNVQIIDLGAESTRPGSAAVDAKQEWARLEPALAMLNARLRGRHVRPWVSVDSRSPEVIERALAFGDGIDLINDVSGLTDPAMIALARDSGCQAVAMHSVSVPADPSVTLPRAPDAATQVAAWAQRRMEEWTRGGLDLNRIIIDPGIGFGKTAAQSFELLSRCRQLRAAGLRLLVGHSRKSFLSAIDAADAPPRKAAHRDLETLGISLALARQGVDILRVHSPFVHQRAVLAGAHVGD